MSVGVDERGRPDERPAGQRWGPLLFGSAYYRRAPGGARLGAVLIWLAFIIFPLVDAIGKREPAVKHGLVIGAAALFVAAYIGMVITWRAGRQTRLTIALFVALLAAATALTVFQASSWGFLFTYCAACAAFLAPAGAGIYAVLSCSALAGITTAIAGANGGTVISYVASSAGIGLLMLVMSDLRQRNAQLNEARAELASMAVAQERERFARDLHDLLGHSLSVITLKAELAGRMLADRPGDAAREIAELEQVARTALSEVRDAVSGYRQPTLDGELAGARMALAAAGVETDVQEARVPLDPTVEAVLAWAVREGATNVIRHSGAHHCTLRISASLTDAGVEVIDDGVGEEASRNGGHGIAGLAERAGLVNGRIEAGALAGGGYRLAVTVPVVRA